MGKHHRNSGKSAKKGNASRSRVKEIVFDPEARRDYLRGFSERKRQRRAFGLAHQKVKDRNAKLEARRDKSNAMLEQVEEAEKQKEEFMDELLKQQKRTEDETDDENDSNKEEPSALAKTEAKPATVTTAYRDGVTQDQWGGNVIVTTSTEIPDDDDDDDDDDGDNTADAQPKHVNRKRKVRSVDEAQEYAGKVDRFLDELKGNMPSKKKNKEHHHNNRQKGRHGADGMRGMASSATGDLKIAQKALARSKHKDKKRKRTRK